MEKSTGKKVISPEVDATLQLLESKVDLYKQMFQLSPLVTILHDLDMNIIDVNNKAIDVFGYSREEFLALSVFDLYSHEEVDHSKQVLDQMQNEKKLVFETSFKRKNGTAFYAEAIPCKFIFDGKPFIHVYIQDISERKTTDLILQETLQLTKRKEEELRKVQQITHVGSWYLDIKTNKVTWTEELYKMYGFDPAKPVPPYTEHMKLFTKESWCTLSESLENTRRTGVSYELELKTIRKDGTNGWMWVRGEAIKDETGEIFGLWGAAQDITDYKNIEEELRSAIEKAETNETKYSRLFDSMQEGMYLHRIIYNDKGKAINYRIVEANPISERYLNIRREDAIGKLATELYQTEEAPFIELYSKVAETGEPVTFEQYFEPMEKYFFISVFSPQKGEFATVFIDITKSKVYEKELLIAKERAEENENTFRKLFDDSSDAILLIDSSGVFVECNQAALNLLKTTREQFLYKSPLLISPEFQPNGIRSEVAATEMIDLAYRDGINRFDWTCINAQNEEFIVEVSLMPIVVKGAVMLYTSWRDITQRIQSEIELKRAKLMAEESDRLKSAFLANMSHEIRTPMNGILGFTDLLKSPKLKPEEQQNYINIIKKGGVRLLHTINEIIDISKIESGQMKVTESEVNFNDALDELYGFFKFEAESKKLQLKLSKVLMHKEAILKTDLDKFNGILTNLIKNAIKYTKKGSIEFGYTIGDLTNEVVFYVKDTGVGIPLERQAAVFERFVQADIENKMAQQGAGLGLAITRAYVKMLKGKIWVESKEMEGSTFYFSLPFYKEQPGKTVDEKPIDEMHHAIGTIKVLIVEDDETSSEFLEIIVGEYASEVICVYNGKDAIEACKTHRDIDLILMDIQMPGMNGYEATHKIRETNRDIVIIAQTAFALSGDRDKALLAGCNDYITKPIDVDELGFLIQKHFMVVKN